MQATYYLYSHLLFCEVLEQVSIIIHFQVFIITKSNMIAQISECSAGNRDVQTQKSDFLFVVLLCLRPQQTSSQNILRGHNKVDVKTSLTLQVHIT